MRAAAFVTLLLWIPLSGCDGNKPPAPDAGDPSGEIQISGGERIGWNQRAADSFELTLFEYAIYVDGARIPLTTVNCSSLATDAGFECSAPLPPMTAGRHTLELASFLNDGGGALESARSAPLRVNMSGATVRSAFAPRPVTTTDGGSLELVRVTEGLNDPVDLAVTSDGDMLIAERAGIVRLVRNAAVLDVPALDISSELPSPADGVLGIALDPHFNQTGFLYLLYTTENARSGFDVVLARFRGVDGRFGERAVLMTRSQSGPSTGALRIGADGKLYVGVESEVLRLNTDATTPDDHVPVTPVYSADHPAPKALDWQPGSARLWVVDAAANSAGRLTAVAAQTDLRRSAAARLSYALPEGTGASSVVFYRGDTIAMFRGDLFVAASDARELMRLRFDPLDSSKVTSVERLLKDQIGTVRVVAQGVDGGLYVLSDTAMYRLRP